MDALSRAVLGAGELGLFVYGVLNRVLIVTGLHHILNNLAWFLLGDYGGVDRRPQALLRRRSDGRRVHVRLLPGDDVRPARRLPRHVPRRARPSAARRSAACCCSMALTSFLTGVTEPIEFTFMFLAPLLYARARGADRRWRWC